LRIIGVNAALRFRRLFFARSAKIFLRRNLKAMLLTRGVFAGLPRLTTPPPSGISHAHAGLAELRPPLPSTFHRSRRQPGWPVPRERSRVAHRGTERVGAVLSFTQEQARYARERHGQGQVFQRDQGLRDLRRRAEEDRRIRDRWRAESREAITALARKLDQHTAAMEKMQPAVAALELSRSKLAAWASIGFAGVVVLGWVVEATVKWAVERAWSYLH
jgi:hypothetical protein